MFEIDFKAFYSQCACSIKYDTILHISKIDFCISFVITCVIRIYYVGAHYVRICAMKESLTPLSVDLKMEHNILSNISNFTSTI